MDRTLDLYTKQLPSTKFIFFKLIQLKAYQRDVIKGGSQTFD